MKICVFQGTFNPIHTAHTDVAEYIKNKYDFDKIIFIPAYNPPHKDVALAQDRFNMVKLALENKNGFEVSDIEYKRGGISYTYLTIKELYEIYDIEDKINFIIGTDAFKNIESWYEADKLKELVKFLVFNRKYVFTQKEIYNLSDKGYDFEIMDLPFNDVSSSELREIIKNGGNTKGKLDNKVEEYIKKHGLYTS